MRARVETSVFVITTNGQLLNEKKYERLKEAGVDQFSISLDYPDERQNEFHHLKRNFEKLSELVSAITSRDHRDVVQACVVQSDNFRDLPKIADVAKKLGAAASFSTYNALRTGKGHLLVQTKEDLADLEAVVDRLAAMQRDGYPIVTLEWTMRQMLHFFREGAWPKCRAGERFMIVNPWGKLTPCGMCRHHYDSPKQIRENFR